MTDRIEMQLRLNLPDPINVDGHKPGSPTGLLAIGQTEARMQMDKYDGEKKRIIKDNFTTPEGHKDKILKLAAESVKQLQIIERSRSRDADARIADLDSMMKIVDGDDPDPTYVTWVWDWLKGMDKSERNRVIENAFTVDGDERTVFAVLNAPPGLHLMNDPKDIERLKREYGKGRNPEFAEEWATLKDNRARLAESIKQAILEITNDSGLGKNTLKDRMNDANDLIRESEIRRTESTEDQMSGKNVRSPHAPNTPVTV